MTSTENLQNVDKLFILGFDAAVKTFQKSIDDIESSEIVGSVRCFHDAAEDIKLFIKNYLMDDFAAMRNNVISEMLISYGDEQ